MNSLWQVPTSSVISLSPERAVSIVRAILRSECAYLKLGPSSLTISEKLMTPDGGIDAEVSTPKDYKFPADCIFQSNLIGFQIKSGATFKPWKQDSVRKELLNKKGELSPEVKRLIQRQGDYSLICTGHDLTPKQRNDSEVNIASIFARSGFEKYDGKINVLGASQIAEFAERYPGTASLLSTDPIQEAWTLEEWQHDAHMTNVFEESPEQTDIISHLRTSLWGETKHIRILGEAGLGKTRIVLEALKDKAIAPYVLYIQHGSQFGQTNLFRQLLKSGYNKPLILVIDELPERDLSDIWRHLKSRCGYLKIISIDHGRDETRDKEIDRLNAPRLTDDTIRKILSNTIGESPELNRWVNICEGSPRVAQAVADNLSANPSDLLQPPATIPIWARFLHGYGIRDEASGRQIDCVAQHLALFSRFGYEAPVEEEAVYIAELIRNIDPTIGWARFQEIVQNLRARRVLQGSRTLFFVPKALHIYLWKQYWERYGRGFNFTQIFTLMPESLHAWFMNMFKYADEANTAHVINDILRPDGIFSQNEVLTSDKGSKFLSILAEANPAAVLKLLAATIGQWPDEEILRLSENRQQFVWTLEKIAVWAPYTVKAMQLMSRLAANENSDYSNNSTGTLLSLFHIGPEWAATESSPETRLPALLTLLRAKNNTEKCLGLKVAEAALDSRGMGFRIVGPEYQGLKERAKLWIPKNYGDLWQASFVYFETLVNETKNWPSALRSKVCNTLLIAIEMQILTPPCTELAFQTLDILADDDAMSPEKLNSFFWNWREYRDNGEHPEITKRLQLLERRYTRRDLVSRFHRYILDVDWIEWDDGHRAQRGKAKSRAKDLVRALARRITQHPDKLNEVLHLLTPTKSTPALWFFGEQLAKNDAGRVLLPTLISVTLQKKHQTCLYGYLSEVKKENQDLYISTIDAFMDLKNSAWLGTDIALSSDYNDKLFSKCLNALTKNWVSPQQFRALRYGKLIEQVPNRKQATLFHLLIEHEPEETVHILVDLLDSISFNDSSPVNSAFVFKVISKATSGEEGRDVMSNHHWKNVCQKLVQWDENYASPLLDVLLTKMRENYRLSYDSYVQPLANELAQANPTAAWAIVKEHFEEFLPKWRFDLVNWLKGGLGAFDEKTPIGVIADLPLSDILNWIDEDPESRAGLIAHAAPQTLDDINGGNLTRELLHKYGHLDDVQSGISVSFHSGGWTGPTSAYLKRKREKFRRWLRAGFEAEVSQWIETEIEHLDHRIEQEEIGEERSRFD